MLCTTRRGLDIDFGQVLEEEAIELVTSVWRQVIFESMAYGEGLHSEKIYVD